MIEDGVITDDLWVKTSAFTRFNYFHANTQFSPRNQILTNPHHYQGLDQIRRGELSLMDRIYVLESKGNHLDASVCYEEAISKDPQNVKLHLGLLKCFSKMGQLSSVLSQVEGLVTKVFVFASNSKRRSMPIAANILLSDRLSSVKNAATHANTTNNP